MKKNLALLGIILIASIGIGLWVNDYINLSREKDRLENNQDILIKENTLFKTKDRLNATEINALTLDIASTKEYYKSLVIQAKQAGIEEGRINSITVVGSITKDTIRLKVRDTIYLQDTLKCFDYKDKFFTIDGCLKRDSVRINYSNRDSLIQVVSRVPKKWWFFKWGTKAIRQTIISSNPKTEFNYQKYIEIK